MYNELVKGRFIIEFSNSIGRRNTVISLFNSLEPFEREHEADICTMSAEELRPALCKAVGMRSESITTQLNILRGYSKWCLENDIPCACDGLQRVSINDLGTDKLKQQSVANPQHLQRYLDCICAKESEETVDCVYRCYYWLAYSGVKEEDAVKLTAGDIDFDDMIIRCGDKEYPIYREAVPSLTKCAKLTQFHFINPYYRDGIECYKNRASGDLLLRGLSDKETNCKTLRIAMSRRNASKKYMPEDAPDNLNLKLSYHRVWLSGAFYKMYEGERAMMPVDFSLVAEEFMEGKEYKLDSGRNKREAKKRHIINEFTTDYNRWKQAYSID